VDAREQERRHLARVMHDELAQSLSAMSATAASIRATASTDCPALLPETEILMENASNIMKGLRSTLRQLRPQEIDDLGLLGSLEGLIASHNHRSRGTTRFMIEAQGDVDALPSAMTVHIFHIVQEGLTNAVKHAQAATVRAVVRVRPASDGASQGSAGAVEVVVEDDGAGMARERNSPAGFGLGLIGIRERVLALGGRMDIRSKPEKGLVLSATIPVSIATAREAAS
jgi:signal transduction histidine kinase